MKRKIWTAILSGAGMLVLILDGKTALSGAADGIELCLKSVIPSLLPFFVISMLLTSSLWGSNFLVPIGRLCGMPEGSESLLIVGLLGGYPVGAQSVAAAYRRGELAKDQAQRLLGFCSNAGPAFIFGIVAGRFTPWWAGLILWIIHIFSALLAGTVLPGKDRSPVRLSQRGVMTLPEALRQSIRVMANVCGWVILFRVLISFLERWILWILPQDAAVMITGLLELTNGCCSLNTVSDDRIRFIIASVILGLGGLCVTMQTLSVTTGLHIGNYLLGKLLQGLFSLIFSVSTVLGLLWLPFIVAAVALIFIKFKKYVEIPKHLIYNRQKQAETERAYAVPKEN